MSLSPKEKTTLDKPLILATRNKGKIFEYRRLLTGFHVDLKGLNDFGMLPSIEENGRSFEENALKKARITAHALGLAAIADDSGLMVEALGGNPGIRSARYAGDDATDGENNLKLLSDMEGITERQAIFICVIVIASPIGNTRVYKGMCNGIITQAPVGAGGFGYDPLFYFPPMKKTFAQMTPEEKNSVSHRGNAMNALKDDFQNIMSWISQ
jgi:XTP/dITP diphosphohydrolase